MACLVLRPLFPWSLARQHPLMDHVSGRQDPSARTPRKFPQGQKMNSEHAQCTRAKCCESGPQTRPPRRPQWGAPEGHMPRPCQRHRRLLAPFWGLPVARLKILFTHTCLSEFLYESIGCCPPVIARQPGLGPRAPARSRIEFSWCAVRRCRVASSRRRL